MIPALKSPIVKYTPLIVIFIYLNLTVLLFFIGPVEYNIENPIKLPLFLLSSHLMIVLGYLFGVSRKEKEINISFNGFNLFTLSVVIFLIFIPLTNYMNTGSLFFNFKNINALGQAYNESMLFRASSNASIIAYIRAIFSPLFIAFLPLGLFYWKKMNVFLRILFLIGVVGGLGLDFFRGTNKTLADYLIVFIFMLIINNIIKIYSSPNEIKRKKSTGKLFIRFFIILILGIVLLNFFFKFFSSTVPERNGLSFQSTNGHYYIDPNHLLINSLPDEGKLVSGTIINYFIQGYHGLDLALSKDFLPTFGFGNSMFLILNMSELLQSNIFFENSYIFRNDRIDNWDWFINWSTFYTWVASDITFFGTVLLMFFIGTLIGKTWKRVLLFKEIPSLIIFIQLILLCFYIPANNQLVQTLEGFVGNTFWFIYWFHIMYFRRIRW